MTTTILKGAAPASGIIRKFYAIRAVDRNRLSRILLHIAAAATVLTLFCCAFCHDIAMYAAGSIALSAAGISDAISPETQEGGEA